MEQSEEEFKKAGSNYLRKIKRLQLIQIVFIIISIGVLVNVVVEGLPYFSFFMTTNQLPPKSYQFTVIIAAIAFAVMNWLMDYLHKKLIYNDPMSPRYYVKKYPQLKQGRKAWFELLGDPNLPEDDRKAMQRFYDLGLIDL